MLLQEHTKCQIRAAFAVLSTMDDIPEHELQRQLLLPQPNTLSAQSNGVLAQQHL
jgi:hypothetical protein